MKLIFSLLILNILSNFSLVYSVINFSEVPLTPAEQQQIIDDINQVRRDANPTGANLREVQWDNCLATVAYEYLKDCPSFGVLNPSRTGNAIAAGCISSGVNVGETTYSSASDGASNPVYIWASQSVSYTYSSNTCATFSCGNYLQLVNAETYLVGCAKIDEADCGREGESILCDFVVSVGKNSPYIQGEPCSSCEVEWPSCNNGLCIETPVVTTTTTPNLTTITPVVTTATESNLTTITPVVTTTTEPNLTTRTPVYTTKPTNDATTYSLMKTLQIMAFIFVMLYSF